MNHCTPFFSNHCRHSVGHFRLFCGLYTHPKEYSNHAAAASISHLCCRLLHVTSTSPLNLNYSASWTSVSLSLGLLAPGYLKLPFVFSARSSYMNYTFSGVYFIYTVLMTTDLFVVVLWSGVGSGY